MINLTESFISDINKLIDTYDICKECINNEVCLRKKNIEKNNEFLTKFVSSSLQEDLMKFEGHKFFYDMDNVNLLINATLSCPNYEKKGDNDDTERY